MGSDLPKGNLPTRNLPTTICQITICQIGKLHKKLTICRLGTTQASRPESCSVLALLANLRSSFYCSIVGHYTTLLKQRFGKSWFNIFFTEKKLKICQKTLFLLANCELANHHRQIDSIWQIFWQKRFWQIARHQFFLALIRMIFDFIKNVLLWLDVRIFVF